MKSIKSTLFIFLLSVFSYSQNIGKIEYSLQIGTDKDKPDLFNKYAKIADQGAEKLTFVLELEKDKSRFYLIDDIRNKDKDVVIAISMIDYENIIYSDLKNNYVLYNNRDDNRYFKKEEFLVKEEVFKSWDLTKETKKIQDFICYKATGTLSYKEGSSTINKSIIAWYYPALSHATGPNGFGGLPGVILELHIDNVLFGATKISINKKPLNITLPTKGEVVNKENYMKTLNKRMDKYNKRIE